MKKQKWVTQEELYLAQNGDCFYCQAPMLTKNVHDPYKKLALSKDHFHPKKKGHSLNNNMVLAHAY